MKCDEISYLIAEGWSGKTVLSDIQVYKENINSEIVSLSSDGVITALNPGNAKIMLKALLSDGSEIIDSMNITVEPISMDDSDIKAELEKGEYFYTGKKIEPKVKVYYLG